MSNKPDWKDAPKWANVLLVGKNPTGNRSVYCWAKGFWDDANAFRTDNTQTFSLSKVAWILVEARPEKETLGKRFQFTQEGGTLYGGVLNEDGVYDIRNTDGDILEVYTLGTCLGLLRDGTWSLVEDTKGEAYDAPVKSTGGYSNYYIVELPQW